MAWGSLGILAAGAFYAIVYTTRWEPLERYFLGHPVAVAATVLFAVGASIVFGKFCQTTAQWNALSAIRDNDLVPGAEGSTLAERWQNNHDAGHVANNWLQQIRELPQRTRASLLIRRLEEVLLRQSQRGTTKHLSDDLRELSGRDADAAFDSFGLVRIIVWAIPMLGFLGTVIGITQTLGGLDFTDGTAAVDRLKSGLYVAFDTTALGLVLSVLAIFLQFPVERSEQRLLSEIDARISNLVSASLPSDDAGDNQVGLIAELCEGIRIAIATSIECQSNLWRQTIDEAKQHWQSVHESDSNKIAEAFENTLRPALKEHAQSLEHSAKQTAERQDEQFTKWQASMAEHQHSIVAQYTAINETNSSTHSILDLQKTIDTSLEQLSATNAAIAQSIELSAGKGMADAMRVLARAVDVLTTRLPSANLSASHSAEHEPKSQLKIVSLDESSAENVSATDSKKSRHAA